MKQYGNQSGGQYLRQDPPNRRRRKKKRSKTTVVVLLLLLVVILTGVALAVKFVRPPEAGVPISGEAVASDVIGADGEIRFDDAERKEDFITILLVGADKGSSGNNTDTIMLMAYDMAKNKVNLMSIPRDTMINVSRKNKKINAAYGQDGGQNIDELMSEVESVVGFRPDRHIIVGLDGFVDMIDTIGGVTLDVPIDMKYSDPGQDLKINIKKGYQTLNGYDAMGFMRFRATYLMGDLDRIEMQHKFIDAFMGQMVRPETVSKVPQLTELFMEHVKTDLTTGNLIWMAKQALSMNLTEDFKMYTLPGEAQYYKQLSYFMVHKKQALELINENFSPYKQEVTELNLPHVRLSNKKYSDELGAVDEMPTKMSENGGKE